MPFGLKARLGALDRYIWGEPSQARPRGHALLVGVARVLLVLGRDVASGHLTLRAMSLVYTTLLSIVPLLALSFSVLKAFGVHHQIEPTLLNLLAPLGERGAEVTQRLIQFIENMNVGVLGSLGLALLLYTAISLMEKVEEAFNFIWRVREMRRFGERFSRYLSALLVGPVLVFAALGLTATVMDLSLVRSLVRAQPFDELVQFVGRVLPYVMVIGAFTFLYMFMPNAPVRPKPALAGGVVGGLLWQTAGWGFATFVAGSTQYTAIYSSFAILVLFMIWVYLCWLVLLIGAAIAFYAQHPEYLRASSPEHGPSNRLREHLAVAAMALVGRRFRHAQPPMTCAELAHAIGAPDDLLEPVLDALQRASLLVQTRDQPPAYVPARDVESIALADVIRVVRTAGELPHLDASRLHMEPQARDAVERIEHGIGDVLRGLSVGTLASDGDGEDGVADEKSRSNREAAGPIRRRAPPRG